MADTIEELQAKLAEANKAVERAKYLEDESKKAFAERDEARKKAREFEELEAKRKQEGLTEVERLKAENEKSKKELEAIQAKAGEWDNFQTKRRDAIKAELKDSWDDSFASLPLEGLEKLREKLLKAVKAPTGTRAGQTTDDNTLETQLKEAEKSGNTVRIVTLKRLINERDRAAA